MKIKKIIKWGILAIFLSFVLIWGGWLVKDGILTVSHSDELVNHDFYQVEREEIYDYDWMRIINYSKTEIKVYFVRNIGEGDYSVGGIGEYRCDTYGKWRYSETILWSTAGTADTLIWPYWHHISYFLFS